MSPTPISSSIIHVVLQYIAPPSQLDHPLPPYLLSKPLLQRHHFLNISPDDPQGYLCWPTTPDKAVNAVALLESLPSPAYADEPRSIPVKYSFDGEHVYAHADLSYEGVEGPRLVFQWDEPDGWKYHDVALMPFPSNTHASLRSILGPSNAASHRNSPKQSDSLYLYGFDNEQDGSDGSDDDDYWNAYGSQDGHVRSSRDSLNLSSDALGEDAYWARYSSVHGTADSTRPSPLPAHRRKPHPLESLPTDPDSPNPLPVRISSESSVDDAPPLPVAATRIMNADPRWGPASPRTLAQLLRTISPRESGPHSPELSSGYESQPDFLSPPERSSGSDDSDTPSPPALGFKINGDSASRLSRSATTRTDDDIFELESEGRESNTPIGDPDVALRQSLAGLYVLYKMQLGRAACEEDVRQAFLRIAEVATTL